MLFICMHVLPSQAQQILRVGKQIPDIDIKEIINYKTNK